MQKISTKHPDPYGWLEAQSDLPGVIRIDEFLKQLERSLDAGSGIGLFRRVRKRSPGQVRLLAELRDTFEGHAHIRYRTTESGWHPSALASRLVHMLDKRCFNLLLAARDSARLLVAMDKQYDVRKEDDPNDEKRLTHYEIAMEGCPASVAYLNWILGKASKQRDSSAVALRNWLEQEAELWFAEHHGKFALANELLEDFTTLVEEDKGDYVVVDEVGLHKAVKEIHEERLALMRQASEQASLVHSRNIKARRAFNARPAPNSVAWPWRDSHPPTGYQPGNGPSWPFPLTLAVIERANPEKLQREGEIRLRLGAVFTHTNGIPVHSAHPVLSGAKGSNAEIARAKLAWQQIQDAGPTLETIGMALLILSKGLSPRRRCSVCQRHLAAVGDRTRCELHRADAGKPGQNRGKRTDIYRMDVWGKVSNTKWQTLLAEISKSSAAMEAARILRSWWFAPIRIDVDGNAGNASQIRLSMSLLTARIEKLEAWVGEAIRDQLLELARHIEQMLLAAVEQSQVSPTGRKDPIIKEMQHKISAQKFFKLHFAGYRAAVLPTDRWHPLVQMTLSAYAPEDLLRDLLLQRAWVESGGLQMDMDRDSTQASVPPPPSQRVKKIKDPARAIEMKRKGDSNVAIAKAFQVSPAAVTKFFQRLENQQSTMSVARAKQRTRRLAS